VPTREVITDADVCDLEERWGVSLGTIQPIQQAAHDFFAETRREVWIVSGYRNRAQQADLKRRGRPTAPFDVSTHTSCPATGVDISLGPFPTRVQKAIWGRLVVMYGLRWGGGGPVDLGGIPEDWQHVDAGPR